jgi:hypothetical protein
MQTDQHRVVTVVLHLAGSRRARPDRHQFVQQFPSSRALPQHDLGGTPVLADRRTNLGAPSQIGTLPAPGTSTLLPRSPRFRPTNGPVAQARGVAVRGYAPSRADHNITLATTPGRLHLRRGPAPPAGTNPGNAHAEAHCGQDTSRPVGDTGRTACGRLRHPQRHRQPARSHPVRARGHRLLNNWILSLDRCAGSHRLRLVIH